MQFNVAQLLKGPTGATRRYEIEADISTLDPDLIVTQSCAGQVCLMRTSQGVLVTARLHTEVELVCDRCLNTFRMPLEIDLEEEYTPTLDIATGTLIHDREADPATLIDEHHILDLREVVRQHLWLSLAGVHHCRPDCAGLCPICGQNLNEGPCECQPVSLDPRWSALWTLRSERTGNFMGSK